MVTADEFGQLVAEFESFKDIIIEELGKIKTDLEQLKDDLSDLKKDLAQKRIG